MLYLNAERIPNSNRARFIIAPETLSVSNSPSDQSLVEITPTQTIPKGKNRQATLGTLYGSVVRPSSNLEIRSRNSTPGSPDIYAYATPSMNFFKQMGSFLAQPDPKQPTFPGSSLTSQDCNKILDEICNGYVAQLEQTTRFQQLSMVMSVGIVALPSKSGYNKVMAEKISAATKLPIHNFLKKCTSLEFYSFYSSQACLEHFPGVRLQGRGFNYYYDLGLTTTFTDLIDHPRLTNIEQRLVATLKSAVKMLSSEPNLNTPFSMGQSNFRPECKPYLKYNFLTFNSQPKHELNLVIDDDVHSARTQKHVNELFKAHGLKSFFLIGLDARAKGIKERKAEMGL